MGRRGIHEKTRREGLQVSTWKPGPVPDIAPRELQRPMRQTFSGSTKHPCSGFVGLSGGERAFPGSSTESAFRERRPIDRGCSPPPYGPADTQPGRPPPPLVPLTRQCIRSASFKPQAIFSPAVELSELSLAPRFLRGTREPADKNQPLRSCHFPVHVSKKKHKKPSGLQYVL